MATARAFAYNPGPSIVGTTQVGDLAVGTPTSGFTYSPRFWEGPDEDLGYVIAVPVPSNTQPTPLSGVTASVGFFRTETFNDSDFISLAEIVSAEYATPQTFTGASEASTWLTNNGFWNSYGNGQNSFTISPSRVSFESGFGANFTSISANGYGIDNNFNNSLYPAYYFTVSDSDADIINVFNSAGIPMNGQGYMFNVTWGPGSTSSNLVKVSYDSNSKQMYMIAVDPTDTNWQNNNSISGTALLGTFNFPATFTPYYPLTDKNSWC